MLFFYLSMIDAEDGKEKFKEIYFAHKDFMYRIAFGFLKDDQLAQEILSQALESVALHIDKIDVDDVSRLKNYLGKVVKNYCFSHLRSKHSKATVLSIDDFSEALTEEDLISRIEGDERYKSIVSFIYRMPEHYRDVLSLHYIDGLDDKSIADSLSRPIATVRSQLRRGTKILREIIKGADLYD